MNDQSPTDPSDKHLALVVDDNQWNRDVIGRRLVRAGYEVITADSGARALECVASQPVDIIILDIMMPGITGIDVLETLRETYSANQLPIIMATAKDQSEDIVEALEKGANDYVTKPLDFPVILARMQAALRAKVAAESEVVKQPETIAAGAVLGEKYRLEEKLGSGNFGQVWSAFHLVFQQMVAIKILQGSIDDSSEALARFQQEGMSAFRLRHPNAVSVLDFSSTPGGAAYLVMELLEGRTLDSELAGGTKIEPARCAEIALPICEVLTEAHEIGLIHRDVKPSNIFLHQERHKEVVKVLDFGIAKLVGDSIVEQDLTVEGGVLGTPAYMAPERLQNSAYDGRSDVYSLAVMIYQMLAGRPLFSSPNNEPMAIAIKHLTEAPEQLRRYRPDLPPPLERLIMGALDKNYRNRPTAPQFGRQLASSIGVAAPSPLLEAREAPPSPTVSGVFDFSDLLKPPANQRLEASPGRPTDPADAVTMALKIPK